MDYVKIKINDIKLDMIKFKKTYDDGQNVKYSILYNGNPFYKYHHHLSKIME